MIHVIDYILDCTHIAHCTYKSIKNYKFCLVQYLDVVWKLVIILTLAEFQFSVNVDVNKLTFQKR